MKYRITCLLFLSFVYSNALKLQDLGGDWILEDDKREYRNLKATVPGGVYTDLLNNNIIEDIFFRYRDTEYKWIPRTNWTYSRTFTVDSQLLSHENVRIKFEGLDTVSTIVINNVTVGDTENMFRQYLFDIKNLLHEGENVIEVRFFNPIEAGEIRNKEFTEGYIIPPECVPPEYNGECYVNQLRKMQASYSWDWGPSFPSVGIWKNVTIEAYNEAVIHYVVADVANATVDDWLINIDVYFSDNNDGSVQGKLLALLEINEHLSVTQQVEVNVNKNEYEELVQYINLTIKKSDVELWWPNGFGQQKLYKLHVVFTSNKDQEQSSKSVRIGFKTIELMQDEVDSGRLYYFKVNGFPMFMKGANEIPLHILPEKGQEFELVNSILTSVRDSHMNMLRIWGGGVYESEVFYDLCDEFGILVWQDLAFASAFYPVRQNFIDNAVLEVRHQTKRLRSHASLAAFCGSNENESNVRGWWAFLNEGDPEQYRADYITLYINALMPEVLRVSHDRLIYLYSSQTSGIHSKEQNYIAQDPNEEWYGDKHLYVYDRDSFDPNINAIPRFIAEYGLQSYPAMVSLKTITDIEEELVFGSDFLHQRDHHPNGDTEMVRLINFQFNIPKEGSPNYTNTIVYYSQVVDGWGMRISTEHYRKFRSMYTEDGKGHTMGALLWQLSDVWVGPSWAGIDSLGRWKVRQYMARHFFAPVIITGLIYSPRELSIYAVSDLLEETLKDLTVTVEVYEWTNFVPIGSFSKRVDVPPSQTTTVKVFNIDDFLVEVCGGDKDKVKNLCFLRLTMKDKNGKDVAPENFVFPGKIKDVWLETPDLKIIDVKDLGDNTFEITLKTDKICLFVWLESHDIRGLFSDNAFHMYTETKSVTFRSNKPTTLEELKRVLTVTNIRNDEFK